jgi:hypothetical protein
MIRPFALIVARTLEGVALALWLGGFAAAGAIVAPLAFGLLERADAGTLMGACFRRLNGIGIGCGVVLLFALAIEAVAHPALPRRLLAGRAALIGGALALAVYLGGSLFPRMDTTRAATPAASPTFDRMHALSRQLLSVQMVLLLGVLVASAASRPTSPALLPTGEAGGRLADLSPPSLTGRGAGGAGP